MKPSDEEKKKQERENTLNWLLSGRRLNGLIAYRNLQVESLPRVIHGLKDEGYKIHSSLEKYKRKNGEEVMIREYFMNPDDQKYIKTQTTTP